MPMAVKVRAIILRGSRMSTLVHALTLGMCAGVATGMLQGRPVVYVVRSGRSVVWLSVGSCSGVGWLCWVSRGAEAPCSALLPASLPPTWVEVCVAGRLGCDGMCCGLSALGSGARGSGGVFTSVGSVRGVQAGGYMLSGAGLEGLLRLRCLLSISLSSPGVSVSALPDRSRDITSLRPQPQLSSDSVPSALALVASPFRLSILANLRLS